MAMCLYKSPPLPAFALLLLASLLHCLPLPARISDRVLDPQPPTPQATLHLPEDVQSPHRGETRLFLLGSGLALFIALLAWSDQIQSLTRDTKDLESKFVASTMVDKRLFLRLVTSQNPDDQLDLLNALLQSAKLAEPASAEALRLFLQWYAQSERLDKLSIGKYYLTLGLTIYLFLSGLSTYAFENTPLRFPWLSIDLDQGLILIAGIFVATILILIIYLDLHERRFHALIRDLSDRIL